MYPTSLSAWQHTQTLAIDATRTDARSPAGAGEAHNDWAYDVVTGRWLYKGGQVATPGGPMASHGGWDWVDDGTGTKVTAASEVVAMEGDVAPAAMASVMPSGRTLMYAAAAAALWLLMGKRGRW